MASRTRRAAAPPSGPGYASSFSSRSGAFRPATAVVLLPEMPFDALRRAQFSPGRARVVDAAVIEEKKDAVKCQRLFAPFAIGQRDMMRTIGGGRRQRAGDQDRSEEHTSELQSLMRISYAVFCLKKKK